MAIEFPLITVGDQDYNSQIEFPLIGVADFAPWEINQVDLLLDIAGTAFRELSATGTPAMVVDVAGTAINANVHASGTLVLALDIASDVSNSSKHLNGAVEFSLDTDGTATDDKTKHGNSTASLAMSLDTTGVAVPPNELSVVLDVTSTATQTAQFRLDSPLPLLTSSISAQNTIPGEISGVIASIFTTDIQAINNNFGSVNASLPMLDLTTAGGGPIAIPELFRITGQFEAVAGAIATVDVSLGALALDAQIQIDSVSIISGTLPDLKLVGNIASGNTGAVSAQLPMLLQSISAASGNTGVIETQFQPITSDITLIGQVVGGIASTLPAIQFVGTISNEVGSAYSAWAVNTETAATSEYVNYEYEYLGVLNDAYLGTKDDGIYLLAGNDDSGTPINSEVELGIDDFKSDFDKRIPKIYVGYKSDGDMKLVLKKDGEQKVYEYDLKRVSHTTGVKKARVKPAKGLKSRYWQLGVKNVQGADFELDELDVLVRVLSRKT